MSDVPDRLDAALQGRYRIELALDAVATARGTAHSDWYGNPGPLPLQNDVC